MSMTHEQKYSFEKRLSRIRKGAANTMGEVHIGPRDEEKARTGKHSNTVRLKGKKKKPVEIRNGSNAALLPIGFLIGGLSMFAGQALAYHLFGDGGLLPIEIPVPVVAEYTQFAHYLFAAALALMFAWTFGMSTVIRKLAVIAGLASVVYFEGDLVQKYPGIYACIFSETYVAGAPEARI